MSEMATTVTIDKTYFETLLRRWVYSLSFYGQSTDIVVVRVHGLIVGRAEFVGFICEADWLLQGCLFIDIVYICT